MESPVQLSMRLQIASVNSRTNRMIPVKRLNTNG